MALSHGVGCPCPDCVEDRHKRLQKARQKFREARTTRKVKA